MWKLMESVYFDNLCVQTLSQSQFSPEYAVECIHRLTLIRESSAAALDRIA